jgi:acyl-CoA thioester hydrolase
MGEVALYSQSQHPTNGPNMRIFSNEAELIAAGIPAGWHFGIADRTRWSEMDPLAHTNNAAYLAWFENVRLSWLSQRKITAFGPGEPKFVIRQVGIDYLGEIRAGEDYIVTLRVSRTGRTSYTQEYAVYVLRNGQAHLATTSHAVIVMLTPDGTSTMPLPDYMVDIFVNQDGLQPVST